MSLTLKSGCAVCSKQESLVLCEACKVTTYCGSDHQVADRTSHKRVCVAIKKAQKALDDEERSLRSLPADSWTPENPFENAVGRFWGLHETRPYMLSRFALVDAILKVKTRYAVQTALDHVTDILRLCRSDNMGVRDLAPSLFLRLGKYQECYDFVKWWATTGRRSNYDWGNPALPHLDLRDEDVCEAVTLYTDSYLDLSHSVSVMLLKIRLLSDLKSLQNSTVMHEVAPQVPPEVLDNIRGQMVSAVVSRNKKIMHSEDQGPLIRRLESQITRLYQAIKKDNVYFWPALLRPGNNLKACPDEYGQGSKEHMQLILQYSYDSWVETPGAIALIKTYVAKDNGR
ncbi:hypothetical protein LSUE1_G004073 [Lachnellula suecica]|uniref:MYND-type domain-containing protein n=1 Tax=Lachnellula suecica TaxID=602035 RepID=A0A8T9CFK2_9HELO|nr:hypothetical protein LSUE1_G004073 [Lachnellula suecica]